MKEHLRTTGLLLLMLISAQAWAQTTISGKVVSSEDNQPIPGVSVLVKGTSIGVITGIDGDYKLEVPSNATTLVYSYLGFKTQEAAIAGRSSINITLQESSTELDEVIITGYQIEDERKITGSVATVKADAIENVPLASIDQILQGQAPGLLIQAGSGQPGAAANVVIRGSGSILGSNQPLYVLDGVPISGQRFNTINPNDIETVSVLKDASATSIYGSRGANGVIVITSKRGKAGKTSINYDFQYGFSNPPENKLELMNTNDKIDFELYTGGTVLSSLSPEEIANLRTVETDWAEVLFQTGNTQQHQVSVTGGNENTTFYVSGNVFLQDGIVIDTELERYTGRFNLTHENNGLRINFNNSLGYSKNTNTLEGNAFIGSALNAIRWTNPYETPFDENGDYTQIRTGQPNALHEIKENPRLFDDIKAVSNVSVKYEIPQIDGLVVGTNWGVDFDQRENRNYTDRSSYSGTQATGQQGSLFRAYRKDVRFIGTNSISYGREFGDDHDFNVALFHEINYRQLQNFSYTGYGLTGNLKNEAGITVSDVFLPNVGGGNSEFALVSFFGNIDYGFKDKYFLKLGLRRDGSSRFGEDNRYATFYSVGASWRIIDEPFMQTADGFLSELKLKASYGSVGNQEGIGAYASRELFASNVAYDGQNGIQQVTLDNSTLQWEAVQMANVGLDFAFWNGRLSGTLEVYNEITNNLFLPEQLSRTTGYTQINRNVGKLRNQGLELSLGADIIQAGDFNWNLSGNITFNDNQILELSDGQEEVPNGFTIWKVGEPLGTNYMVEYVGVNPANGDALYRKLDGSITSQFSSSDLQSWGTRQPPRFGGFTNNFSYKGLSLTVFFNWVEGNEVYNNDRTNVENPTYVPDQMSTALLRAWRAPGDMTDVPRVQSLADGWGASPFRTQTTRYLENGSYLRLRNIMLSYSLPQAITAKANLESVRVFIQGQNLWTRTEFQGWDPELAAGTLVGAQYPAMKQLTFGVNVGI